MKSPTPPPPPWLQAAREQWIWRGRTRPFFAANPRPGQLHPAPGGSFCEWKGPARYWSLVDGDRRLPSHAWSYPQPLAGAEALAECVAFYARDLACSVGDLPATPQPGGFYGGWVTPDLAGPFKGEAGSETW